MLTMQKQERITDKRRMYELLQAGELGNTMPQFFDVAVWQSSPDHGRYPLWGLRSMERMGPVQLDVPTVDVPQLVAELFRSKANISPMVDQWLTFRCEVWDAPGGWLVWGTFDRELKWRAAMASTAREWTGVAAKVLLRELLSPGSLDDLETVLDRFPGHIVEMTILDRCRGRFPGRNAVVWEVRDY